LLNIQYITFNYAVSTAETFCIKSNTAVTKYEGFERKKLWLCGGMCTVLFLSFC